MTLEINHERSPHSHHAGWSRPKVALLSAAALAVFAATVIERPRIDALVAKGRDQVSRLMRLDQIDWVEVGVSNLSGRVNKDLMMAVSGLKIGQEMLPIDLGDLESRLMTVPWIESVQIQKKLPSTLLVRYTVHNARALGMRRGKPWSISDGGHWIAPLIGAGHSAAEQANAALDLPILGSTSDEMAGVPFNTNAVSATVSSELRWLDALETGLGNALLQVHEINLVQGRTPLTTALVELQYSSQSVKVMVYGQETPDEESLNRLNRVVRYLIKNNILVSKIDLRLGKKVVVNVGKRP